MRIVHLSTQHPALDVRIFYKECRTLAAAGHDVHLIVPGPLPQNPALGVHFHRLEKRTSIFRAARIFHRLHEIYRQAAALRGDVYHFHDPELMVVGLLLKADGCRVVYDVHEDSPREALTLNQDRPWRGRLLSWAWSLLESVGRRAFDRFVCATPAIARRFPHQRTVTVQNFPLLDDGTDTSSSTMDGSADLIYAGWITAVRGASEMVQTVGILPASLRARLVLMGSIHPLELLGQLKALAGWERVHYAGHQPRMAVQVAMRKARVGLVLFRPQVDHLESQPNKLFEYMAAGLPVVASNFPLWRRIVSEAECGLTVDPLDPAAAAQAIQFLLENGAQAAAMGKRGRAAVQSRYNWQPEAKKLLGLYESLEAA